MFHDLLEITPMGELRVSMDPDGRLTYLHPEIVDKMSAVLWDELADHTYWGYSDEASYWDLDELSQEALRLIVHHVLRPLMSPLG